MPPLTIEETRKRIAALPEDERCHPGCPGWDIFETNTDRGTEVERCDECFGSLPDDRKVWDDDVQQLPEAIAKLAELMSGNVMFTLRDALPDEVRECIDDGLHLKSCDDDGYCNACGYQEGGNHG